MIVLSDFSTVLHAFQNDANDCFVMALVNARTKSDMLRIFYGYIEIYIV
jgi:hypothetical protein